MEAGRSDSIALGDCCGRRVRARIRALEPAVGAGKVAARWLQTVHVKRVHKDRRNPRQSGYISESRGEYFSEELWTAWIPQTTFTDPPPSFTVENFEARGQTFTRATIRINRLYPGESIQMRWLYLAPENTTLYDVPQENKAHIVYRYSGPQLIKVWPHVYLTIEENWPARTPLSLEDHGKTWFELRLVGWLTAPGWFSTSSRGP